MNCLAQILVLLVVRIFSLDLLAALCVELYLNAALPLDFLVGKLDGAEHHVLGNLVHLALDHHDVLLGGCDHKFEVSLLHLGEVRVDLVFAVDSCHPDLGDRAEERKVAGCESCRSRESGECIRLYVLLRGDEPDVHEHCQMEIIREERSESPVHKTCDEDLVV